MAEWCSPRNEVERGPDDKAPSRGWSLAMREASGDVTDLDVLPSVHRGHRPGVEAQTVRGGTKAGGAGKGPQQKKNDQSCRGVTRT